MFNSLVNLNSLYSKQVRTLSLGQRMLCDITAAFLHNPKIIFLDEPTIGLDISIKSKIRSIIKELNRKQKTTIILTTHDISDIEALCKRIVIIDKGKIIYDDDIKKITTIFGAYRTLSLSIENESVKKAFCEKIKSVFKKRNALTSEITDDGWINLTVNQDKIKFVDILNFATQKYQIKDVKIEEIKVENVIQKIYDGDLL
jgi:ABC-2 type transport system ATP-binding protein